MPTDYRKIRAMALKFLLNHGWVPPPPGEPPPPPPPPPDPVPPPLVSLGVAWDMNGPMLTRAAEEAFDSRFATLNTIWETYEPDDWAVYLAGPRNGYNVIDEFMDGTSQGGANYCRGKIYEEWYEKTGDIQYRNKFLTNARNWMNARFRSSYLDTSKSPPVLVEDPNMIYGNWGWGEQYHETWHLALLYKLAGDVKAGYALGRCAARANYRHSTGFYRWSVTSDPALMSDNNGSRWMYRDLFDSIGAYFANAPNVGDNEPLSQAGIAPLADNDFKRLSRDLVDDILWTQRPDGAWRWWRTPAGGGYVECLPFQHALLFQVLITYDWCVSQDRHVEIVACIEKGMQFLERGMRALSGFYFYNEMESFSRGIFRGTEAEQTSADLSGWFVDPAAWLYHTTGNPTWLALASRYIDEMITGPVFYYSYKQLSEFRTASAHASWYMSKPPKVTEGRPVNTVAPVITGSLPVGSTLSLSNGTWNGNPSSHVKKFYRYVGGIPWPSASTVPPVVLLASSGSYTTTNADRGYMIFGTVAAVNGSGTGVEKITAKIGPIT